MKHIDRIILVAVIGLLLFISVGCAITNATTSSASNRHAAETSQEAPVMAMPTPQDKLLIKQYDALMQELDDTIAREIFNHYRHNQPLRHAHDAILNAEPLDVAELGNARRYFTSQIATIQKSRHWLKPIDYTIARAQGRIVIDGRMDEKTWEAATPIALEYDFNNPVPVPSNAAARMLWDDQYLYTVFVVPDRDIQAPKLPNDAPAICTFDCAELFIMPHTAWDLYWEINASPNGPVYDALNFWRRDSWASASRIDLNIKGLLIKTSTLDSKSGGPGYVMEMAIPWNQMPMPAGQSPNAGDQLKGLMGIAQLNMVDGKRHLQYLSHSPMLATFHNIRTLPTLTLGR